jgi:hypothetical protein
MRIFISYRREDSEFPTMDLDEALKAETIGGEACETFRDVDAIPPGSPFANDIDGAVRSCDVVLAVIGRYWLEAAAARQREQTDDWVRTELATAVASGIPVLVVLVEGANPPSAGELPADIRAISSAPRTRIDDAQFDASIRTLVKTLAGLGIVTRGRPAPATLRLASDRQGWFGSDDRRYVRVNGKKVGLLLSGTPHTDFPVPAGTCSVTLGRGLFWSDPLTVVLTGGKTTTVLYRIGPLGRERLWLPSSPLT